MQQKILTLLITAVGATSHCSGACDANPSTEQVALVQRHAAMVDKSQSDTSAVYGMWTVERVHENAWRTTQHNHEFCGMSTDTFSLGYGPSKYCKKKSGTEGYAVFDQSGVMVAPGWFCTDKAKPRIHGTKFLQNADCQPVTSTWGKWRIARKCDKFDNAIEEDFCGFKTATFKVHPVASKFCKNRTESASNYGSAGTGWAVVDQGMDQVLWPWFCTDRCKPEITSRVFTEDFSCVLDEDKEDVADEQEENVIGLSETDDGLLPDCPQGLPEVNTQGGCKDIANPYMQSHGNPCTAGWIIRKRCSRPKNTHLDYWTKCQFCAQTCSDAGFGYAGLNCSS